MTDTATAAIFVVLDPVAKTIDKINKPLMSWAQCCARGLIHAEKESLRVKCVQYLLSASYEKQIFSASVKGQQIPQAEAVSRKCSTQENAICVAHDPCQALVSSPSASRQLHYPMLECLALLCNNVTCMHVASGHSPAPSEICLQDTPQSTFAGSRTATEAHRPRRFGCSCGRTCSIVLSSMACSSSGYLFHLAPVVVR